jgi:adenylyltransferase/sulfurtransferase
MNNFYQRQIILPFVGITGQEKLSNSKVLIIGAGGLGHPTAIYLAGAGVGTIGILDFDIVEYTNIHRQIYFTPDDIGTPKAEILAHKIALYNPLIKVHHNNAYLSKDNIQDSFSQYEIIIDCCDNLETKYLIHQYCFHLNKVLVQGSIAQIEGVMNLFDFTETNKLPCWRCLWDEIPPGLTNCTEAGVLPTTAGVFGSLLANEVLKFILNTPHLINGESFIFNLISLQSSILKWKTNPSCKLCSDTTTPSQNTDIGELAHYQIQYLSDYQIIDLRSEVLTASDIDPGIEYLLICETGMTSLVHSKILRLDGFTNIWSLKGGIKCLTLIK